MPDFAKRLTEPGVILMDGATGTELYKRGLGPGESPELWNLQRPDDIKAHHRSFIEAGSDVILTNTFGGNRIRLGHVEAADQATLLNRTAAELARDVAGDRIFVLGSLGPTGEMLGMPDAPSEADIQALFAEQAAALVAGGVDGLHVETMMDLNEALAAVRGAKEVANGLPITATMSFDRNARTMYGVRAGDAVRELAALGVLAVGVNCGRSLADNLTAFKAMQAAGVDVQLIAKPNAGLPTITPQGETQYDVSAAEMGQSAQTFITHGAKMIGGCCGTSPAHVQAIRAVIDAG